MHTQTATFLCVGISAALAAFSPAFAQDAAQEAPAPGSTVADALIGSWSQEGEQGAVMHFAPLQIEGVGPGLYVEYATADRLGDITGQEVWRVYESADGPRIRVSGFLRDDGLRRQLGGLWLAPDLLPAISQGELYPKYDLMITPHEGGGFTAETAHPYPADESGAGSLEMSLEVENGAMTGRITHRDASGAASKEVAHFQRFEPDAQIDKRENGLVIIDLHAGTGTAAAEGDTVQVHYTGWNETGDLFDTSRVEWRAPFTLQLPGQVIQGWQEGLIGMRTGQVRRLIIPPDLAYGPRRVSPQIGPGETLTFRIECLSIKTQPQPPTAPNGGG